MKTYTPTPLNLFCTHGHDRGCATSAKLIMLLTANGWKELWRTGKRLRDPEGYHCSEHVPGARATFCQIHLQAPAEFNYKQLCLCDNATELNVSWVNLYDFPSIPDSAHGMKLNAETMHYRIMTMLQKGFSFIDWDKMEEPLTNEQYAAILKA
jgi:hypothetical protein